MDMAEQESKENIPPEDSAEDIVSIVRRIPLVYRQLPSYIQELMKAKNALKAQFIATNQPDKKVELNTVFEALENELRLQQYRVYRRKHPDLVVGPDEQQLQSHLGDFMGEVVKKSVKNRMCYITTREAAYKNNYVGMKNAMKVLVAAVDGRFGYEIMIGLDSRTLKIIRE